MKTAILAPIFGLVFLAFGLSARAAADPQNISSELEAASNSIIDGNVTSGIDTFKRIFYKIDPAINHDLYWRTGFLFSEWLATIEDTNSSSELISELIKTAGPNPTTEQQFIIQLSLGRLLFMQGNYAESEKYLRALIDGDAKYTFTNLQRSAAILLVKIELSRGDIRKASILTRRVIAGLDADSGASSTEIVQILTEVANYLIEIRRAPEGIALISRLNNFYDKYTNHKSPLYIRFQTTRMRLYATIGDYTNLDLETESLTKNIKYIDIVPVSVKNYISYQDLFRDSRKPDDASRKKMQEKIMYIESQFPQYMNDINVRIQFGFFALVSNDLKLAKHLLDDGYIENKSDFRTLGYRAGLKSLIAALEGDFDGSIELVKSAISSLMKYHDVYQSESATRLPSLTVEEKGVLTAILNLDLPSATTDDQKDTLFRVGQLVNREKISTGIAEKAFQQTETSALKMEDARTLGRLRETRDKLLDASIDNLISKILPIRNQVIVKNNDFSALIRLEDFEDKIYAVNQNEPSVQTRPIIDIEEPVGLKETQALLHEDEALLLQTINSGVGLITQCVTYNSFSYQITNLNKATAAQLLGDEKLMSAAVHNENPPSEELNSSVPNFPFESAHRLYEFIFGGIDSCIIGKRHLLLATDADFFALPWNAFLTALPDAPTDFSFRTAAWLPRTFATSLLPSIRSLEVVRHRMGASTAQKNFLGIGDPDFRGAALPSSRHVIRLSSLFTARGVANKDALRSLPPLPEASAELRSEAGVLAAAEQDLLLRNNATERSLRDRQLNDYRIISFATHAVIAGEIEGVTEAALVLSPVGGDSSSQDDGLLTLTKIANLSLDANLIILSACNTGASDGTVGGRGLSGLANAFFFAGARAVAVTQWPVVSSSAQRLASEMVNISTHGQPMGVSAALRKAMLEYIDSAKQDYLADPRFWAPFVVAGDGAIHPLNSKDQAATASGDIALSWEARPPLPDDREFLSSARDAHGKLYALGIESPAASEKRAGSYVAKLNDDGKIEVLERTPDIGASGIAAFGDEIAVLGYVPTADGSIAVWRLLDAAGKEKWRYIEDEKRWSFPVTIFSESTHYIIVSLQRDFSGKFNNNKVRISKLDLDGKLLRTEQYTLKLNVDTARINSATVMANGNLIISFGGHEWPTAERRNRVWINPLTGSKKYCQLQYKSEIFIIDKESFSVNKQHEIDGLAIKAITTSGSHVYGVFAEQLNCRLETSVVFAEIDDTLEPRIMFHSNNVNSFDVRDIHMLDNGIILMAGSVSVLLPTSVTKAVMTSEELKKNAVVDIWSDTIWDATETRNAAAIVALKPNGVFLTDAVFSDARNRGFVAMSPGPGASLVGVGAAYGDYGWAAGIKFGEKFRAR